jgi:predicted metal-binding protein
MPDILSICRTCDRYALPPVGEATPGERLADQVAALLRLDELSQRIALRRVTCQSGCKHPCNIALSAFGKTRLRLHRLTATEAVDILALARRYVENATGEVPDAEFPPSLRGCLAARVPPWPHSG